MIGFAEAARERRGGEEDRVVWIESFKTHKALPHHPRRPMTTTLTTGTRRRNIQQLGIVGAACGNLAEAIARATATSTIGSRTRKEEEGGGTKASTHSKALPRHPHRPMTRRMTTGTRRRRIRQLGIVGAACGNLAEAMAHATATLTIGSQTRKEERGGGARRDDNCRTAATEEDDETKVEREDDKSNLTINFNDGNQW